LHYEGRYRHRRAKSEADYFPALGFVPALSKKNHHRGWGEPRRLAADDAQHLGEQLLGLLTKTATPPRHCHHGQPGQIPKFEGGVPFWTED
jgi:hypothetical protein